MENYKGWHKPDEFDKYDLTTKVGDYQFNENKKMTRHNIFMYGLLAITFIVAGLQALHGMTPFDSIIDMVLPVLVILEHSFSGKTS